MIKTNELRQGNLLQCQFKVDGPMHIITITGVKDNFIAWTAKGCCPATFVFLNDSYKPIPLSTERLERMGFRINHYTYTWDRALLSLSQNLDPGMFVGGELEVKL